MTESPWWIFCAFAQMERRAAKSLAALGFEAWVPMRRVTISNRYTKHLKAQQVREYPVAGGLLLARPEQYSDAIWQDYRDAKHVRGVLCVDGRPLTASARDVEAFRERLAAPDMPMVEDAFRIGEMVHITDGPFCSFSAVVSQITGRGNLKVEVEMFGRPTPVELERGQVERVA